MSPGRGNPAPRAALRKAPDADVHPATTVPRSASGAVVATPSTRSSKPAATPTPKPAAESATSAVAGSGSTRASAPKTSAPKANPKPTNRQAARVTPPADGKAALVFAYPAGKSPLLTREGKQYLETRKARPGAIAVLLIVR